MSEKLRPSVLAGSYPEKLDPMRPRLERWLSKASERRKRPSLANLEAFAQRIVRRSDELRSVSADELRQRADALRPSLRRALAGPPLLEALAIVREQSRRHLGMAHFEVQIMAGCALLRGMLVELDTGEGKTLSGTLPAAVAALAGIPVHVVTVNDYLVERDAEAMAPLFQALGLSTGRVIEDEPDPAARRAAYASDITYVSNKQVAFDYLRDRISLGGRGGEIRGEVQRFAHAAEAPLLRGLCFAILDEADSVLVDEARTPLILSRTVPSPGLAEIAHDALSIARELDEKEDLRWRHPAAPIEVTASGQEKIIERCEGRGGVWNAPARRAELLRVALDALYRYKRDEHYIVRDGQVEIVDPQTGRSMPDRSWEGGLQQMVELKEGCELSGDRETLARMSYQQFYRRYLRLSGMTGTGREVRREIEAVYDMPMIRIPPRRPSKRIDLGVHVMPTVESKWNAAVDRITELHRSGRPVLVGTASVKTSELLSERLDRAGLTHRLLNARQDHAEAEIIGEAGFPGRITLATAMAGRGSDIRVEGREEELGGLHVISVERADSGRVDRQLYGRCGRQGDAGSFEQIVSLEDELVRNEATGRVRRLVVAFLRRLGGGSFVGRLLFQNLQRRVERRHARERRAVMRQDEQFARLLSFSGTAE